MQSPSSPGSSDPVNKWTPINTKGADVARGSWEKVGNWGTARQVRVQTSAEGKSTVQLVSKNIFERMASKITFTFAKRSFGGTVSYQQEFNEGEKLNKESIFSTPGIINPKAVGEIKEVLNKQQDAFKAIIEEARIISHELADLNEYHHFTGKISGNQAYEEQLRALIKKCNKGNGYELSALQNEFKVLKTEIDKTMTSQKTILRAKGITVEPRRTPSPLTPTPKTDPDEESEEPRSDDFHTDEVSSEIIEEGKGKERDPDYIQRQKARKAEEKQEQEARRQAREAQYKRPLPARPDQRA